MMTRAVINRFSHLCGSSCTPSHCSGCHSLLRFPFLTGCSGNVLTSFLHTCAQVSVKAYGSQGAMDKVQAVKALWAAAVLRLRPPSPWLDLVVERVSELLPPDGGPGTTPSSFLGGSSLLSRVLIRRTSPEMILAQGDDVFLILNSPHLPRSPRPR